MVRKSGRIVIVANGEGNAAESVVIKVPCTSWLLENEQRNVDALRSLHESDAVPAHIKRLVPRHLASGEYGGQRYFVEDTLSGTKPSDVRMTCQVAATMLELHQATARIGPFGDKEFSVLRNALVSLRSVNGQSDYQTIWNTIEEFLEHELLGRQIPHVWSHGDPGSNYLLDRNGRLCGIMDWETFDKNGLPLYDWTLLCVGRKAGWMCLRSALNGQEHAFFEHLSIDDYLERLDLDRRLVPALALSAWVKYVEHRFRKRGCDSHWLRNQVFNVLRLCRELL